MTVKKVISTNLDLFSGQKRATPVRIHNPECKHRDGFDAVDDPANVELAIVYCLSCDYEIKVKRSRPI